MLFFVIFPKNHSAAHFGIRAHVKMPRLRRDPQAGKQLLDRDEAVTLRRERVNGAQSGLHAFAVSVVQQHDVPAVRVLHDAAGYGIGQRRII